jgi:hypothetical protein
MPGASPYAVATLVEAINTRKAACKKYILAEEYVESLGCDSKMQFGSIMEDYRSLLFFLNFFTSPA